MSRAISWRSSSARRSKDSLFSGFRAGWARVLTAALRRPIASARQSQTPL
jgi:hypothetical protein